MKLLGKKGQSGIGGAMLGLGVAAVIIMVVGLIIGEVYTEIPTDLTGTANTTVHSIGLDTLSNFANAPLAIMVGVFAVILTVLMGIMVYRR